MDTSDPADASDVSMASATETDAETAVEAEGAELVDRATVRARLDRVHDPELDRSIVDLQYVDAIEIDDGAVTVRFVLPTAWCSPAFAWMMATGIRDEVRSLPAVSSVTVHLDDHMHGDEITAGVNEGRPFEAVFAEADDGIEAVRRTLDEKARFARQHDAMRALEDAGLDAAQIATLTRGDVDIAFGSDLAAVSIVDGALTVTVPREPVADYLAKAEETGVVSDDSDRLFVDRDGDPITPSAEAVDAVRQDARLASANITGQAAICESLHESRNDVTLD